MEELITFQERAIRTRTFHIEKCREASKNKTSWNIAMTASALRRSFGAVAEDIMIADWLRVYPQLEKMVNVRDALKFIREKKKEMKLRA
jgi:hypothetical protein